MLCKLLCVGVSATALSSQLSANCEKPFTKKMYCSAKAEADKNPDAKYLEEGKCRRVKKNGKDKKVCNKDGKITVKDVDPKDSSSSHKSKTSSGSDSDSEKSKK
ncbi:MAG: hypothetical protein ACPGUZ_02065 [Holosporaceae bacterium]